MNSSKFVLLTMLAIAFSLSVFMTISILDKAYAGSILHFSQTDYAYQIQKRTK